jgi:hypothetical protein
MSFFAHLQLINQLQSFVASFILLALLGGFLAAVLAKGETLWLSIA